MDNSISYIKEPKFRESVNSIISTDRVEIIHGSLHCSFEFSEPESQAVTCLINNLRTGGVTVSDLLSRLSEIAEKIPPLLEEFDRLHLLTETRPQRIDGVCSGAQLYREVARLTDRLISRLAKSNFQRALFEGRATRKQLIGYALEYYWIVQTAPSLIGPALGSVKSRTERLMLEGFLKSELGHDQFLATALKSIGLTQADIDFHQPLPATFMLCASLGVYARQDPLSFKACLFLFERAQPSFIDAFDHRCRELGLPETFYGPMRVHADINEEYDHDDISRSLMALESAIDPEACNVVKRHVSLMVETLLKQEDQILAFYGKEHERIPRIFG